MHNAQSNDDDPNMDIWNQYTQYTCNCLSMENEDNVSEKYARKNFAWIIKYYWKGNRSIGSFAYTHKKETLNQIGWKTRTIDVRCIDSITGIWLSRIKLQTMTITVVLNNRKKKTRKKSSGILLSGLLSFLFSVLFCYFLFWFVDVCQKF